MEMRAVEDIAIGQDLTPPIPPIAAALHHSHHLTHCAACFSPLLSAPFFSTNTHHVPSPFLRYCSPRCNSLDSPLHFSSAEFHLLHQSPTSTRPDSSDLRLSLRLLRRFETLRLIPQNDDVFDRIGGLMTNRAEFLRMENREDDIEPDENDDVLVRIKEGARAMAAARRMRDGLDLELSSAGECAVEAAVFCLVLTNAVEVQDSAGCIIGVAVYGPSFSWINHGCSPNSSYRFSTMPSSGAASRLLIYPASTNGDTGNEIELINGIEEGYGPRLIVRSIKAIKKGEEILITYTDLLQPKGMRQSELSFKYQFTCCCIRCNADPATYVDHVLLEISVVNLDCPTSTSTNNFAGNFAYEKLTECFDDAMDDFLTFNNSISCSGKLENLLIHGYVDEQLKPNGEKSRQIFKLHPFHHLSLNAYITLTSSYKVLASELLAIDMDRFKAFSICKASAAYSLLLAGSSHHLFCHEPSLIVSVANYWTGAGESLLNLVKSSLWDPGFDESSSFSSKSCNKCTLHNRFKASFIWSGDSNAEFSEISRQFLNCITNLTPKVWRFLVGECRFLNLVKDPINFRWVESTKFSLAQLPNHFASSELETEADLDSNRDRTVLFQIGLHCLLYGSFLSSVCSAHHTPSNGQS